MRPLTSELMHVYITGDGTKFLNRKKAEKYHKFIEGREKDEQAKNMSNVSEQQTR